MNSSLNKRGILKTSIASIFCIKFSKYILYLIDPLNERKKNSSSFVIFLSSSKPLNLFSLFKISSGVSFFSLSKEVLKQLSWKNNIRMLRQKS